MQAIRKAVFRTMALFAVVFLLAMNVASLTVPVVAGAVSGVLAKAGIETVAAKQRKAVRAVSKRVAARTARGAVRNVGTMPAEAVPAIGAAVIAGVTAWEIADACATMEDMAELDRAFGITPPDNAVCGMEVPAASEIGGAVLRSPGRVWEAARETWPDLGLPAWEDAAWTGPWRVFTESTTPQMTVSPAAEKAAVTVTPTASSRVR